MGEMLQFPKTIEKFFEDYAFTDSKEVYTNKALLIPVFRVKQALEHYFRDTEPVRQARWVYLGNGEWCCSNCGEVIHTEDSWPTKKYCYECGAKLS